VFFKVDGETVVLDLIGDDVFLSGTCTVATTAGSHGNLGRQRRRRGRRCADPVGLG
jgi:hypothetical protein